MSYKILEARIEWQGTQITKVTALVDINEDGSDLRAISATNRHSNGYAYINIGEKLSDELLQRVAGYGCGTGDPNDIILVFPDFSKHKKQRK
ncbi:MAG: hypothetical protein JWO03_908 [Bacteroidetes bacterium]|nr:hypothetical protein [Bacteroidota bacterium]